MICKECKLKRHYNCPQFKWDSKSDIEYISLTQCFCQHRKDAQVVGDNTVSIPRGEQT